MSFPEEMKIAIRCLYISGPALTRKVGGMIGRIILVIGLVAVLAVAGAWYMAEPSAPAGADAGNPKLVALGELVYGAQCASCHGVRLEGQANWRSRNPDGTLPAPPHDASGHTWHHPDGQLFTMTKRGGKALAPPGFISAMPGFGAALNDGEIWAVLAYIKSRWPRSIRLRHDSLNARVNQR